MSALRSTCISKGVPYHLHHAIATLEGRFQEPPLQSDYLQPLAHSRILLLQRLATAGHLHFRPTDYLLRESIADRSNFVPMKKVQTIQCIINGEGEFYYWTDSGANCSFRT
ncbi:hypothetical protein MRX96_014336 [Rhipicephalus microplus]